MLSSVTTRYFNKLIIRILILRFYFRFNIFIYIQGLYIFPSSFLQKLKELPFTDALTNFARTLKAITHPVYELLFWHSLRVLTPTPTGGCGGYVKNFKKCTLIKWHIVLKVLKHTKLMVRFRHFCDGPI